MNRLVMFFARALKHLRAELKADTYHVKPQFLIDDDDDYQDALEKSWHNRDKYDEINDIDAALENHEKMVEDMEVGWFIELAAQILDNNGYKNHNSQTLAGLWSFVGGSSPPSARRGHKTPLI